jgi:hypothetical protein
MATIKIHSFDRKNLKAFEHWMHPGTYSTTTEKRIFNKLGGGVWIGFIWLRIGPRQGCSGNMVMDILVPQKWRISLPDERLLSCHWRTVLLAVYCLFHTPSSLQCELRRISAHYLVYTQAASVYRWFLFLKHSLLVPELALRYEQNTHLP